MSRRSTPRPEPLWLCLCFGQLPLEVFARGNEQATAPIVITEGGRVCRLNEAAADLGIEMGSTMNTALSISEKLSSFERDPDKERVNLDRLAQWAYQFTPGVSVMPPASLVLEIGSCLKLWGGWEPLRDRIETGLHGLGFVPALGRGHTPLAARLGATASDDRIASIESIRSMSVDRLASDPAIEPKHIADLHRMGIRTIGRLLDLPTSSLNRRFGVYFTNWLGRMTGELADPQKFITPEPHFFSEINFLADVTDKEALRFPINRLLTELGEFLTGRQLYTSHLSWRLSHRSHEPLSFSISMAEPENDPALFLSLTQLKLERVPGIREVDSLSLTVREFSTAEARTGGHRPVDELSGDLFQGTRFRRRDGRVSSIADHARANALLNMLGARLGSDSCFGLSVADDHRPEKAWRTVRAAEITRREAPSMAGYNPRPAFLLTTPRPLRSERGEPFLEGKLILMRGPERIDYGWWDLDNPDRPAARDYYVARSSDGALFWIFEYPVDPSGASTNSRWYLHGIFS